MRVLPSNRYHVTTRKNGLFADLMRHERQIELNVDPADIDSSLDSDSPIKVGDNVETVSDTASRNE